MRRISFFSGCLVVLLLVGFGFSAYSFTLMDQEKLNEARIQGIEDLEAGEYRVWVWSLDKESLTVVVDGERLAYETSAEAGEKYSWKLLGSVQVEERDSVPLGVYTDFEKQFLEDKVVGWLALAEDEHWNPEEFFHLTRLFEHSDETVQDPRVTKPRTLDDFHYIPEYDKLWRWYERKQELRNHMLVSLGAYPEPERTPLNINRFSKIEGDDYVIEKIHFESFPGFYVTGNLFIPKEGDGPFPAVLCPHGHWGNGRFEHSDTNKITGRGVHFAKQGYVAFTIDMIGYVDSQQMEHRWHSQEENLWGFSAHGLQYWNNVRAVDFLSSLDFVDEERIACTGASGGGTQTYTLMALDPRIKAAAPVNMISAHFQGGCVCENAPNLRIDANNVEIAAMMAPRPLMMIAATGDWTRETYRVEYPAIRSVYQLFDAEEKVRAKQMDAPHNYNQQSREAVYAAFGEWLLGKQDYSYQEEELEIEDFDALRVFPDGPPEGAVTRDELFDYYKKASEEQLREVFPEDDLRLRALRRRAGQGLRHAVSAQEPDPRALKIERVDYVEQSQYVIEKYIIGRDGEGDQIPGILLVPDHWKQAKTGTLLLHEKGKAAFYNTQKGKVSAYLQALLDRGYVIFMPDLFLTGEYHTPFAQQEREREVSHFYTYNQSDYALRVQDILTSLAFLQGRHEVEKVHMMAMEDAGLWGLLAAPLAETSLQSLVLDMNHFSSSENEAFLERLYIPSLRRVGDVRSAQALVAPSPMILYNTGTEFHTDWAEQAYQTEGVPDLFEALEGSISPERMNTWLDDIE